MDSTKCAFCNNSAICKCSCNAHYCNTHQQQHDSLLGVHIKTVIKVNDRFVNLIQKIN